MNRKSEIRDIAQTYVTYCDRKLMAIVIPDKANIVACAGNGAWVDAQVWVPFEETKYDKTKPKTYDVMFTMAFSMKGVVDPDNVDPVQVRGAVNRRMSDLDDGELVHEAIAICEAIEEQR